MHTLPLNLAIKSSHQSPPSSCPSFLSPSLSSFLPPTSTFFPSLPQDKNGPSPPCFPPSLLSLTSLPPSFSLSHPHLTPSPLFSLTSLSLTLIPCSLQDGEKGKVSSLDIHFFRSRRPIRCNWLLPLRQTLKHFLDREEALQIGCLLSFQTTAP